MADAYSRGVLCTDPFYVVHVEIIFGRVYEQAVEIFADIPMGFEYIAYPRGIPNCSAIAYTTHIYENFEKNPGKDELNAVLKALHRWCFSQEYDDKCCVWVIAGWLNTLEVY